MITLEDIVVGTTPRKRRPISSHGSIKPRLVAHRLTIAKVAAEVTRLFRIIRRQQVYNKVNEFDDDGS